MMQNLWQKKLKLNYSEDVLDIVQFGSSIMEGKEPNDIDIAVIFKNIPIKKQLIDAQKIKKQIQNYTQLPVDVKSFDLISFFDEANFAKESILFYGKSIISKEYFSKNLFGLIPKIQIYYSLKNLEKRDKVRFHYMLQGKKGSYGLIKKYGGRLLSPGVIEIFPEYEKIFTDSIEKNIKNFEIKKILIKG